MANSSQDYFNQKRLAQQRREVEDLGLVADDFLASNPDCPVFGLNLTCAFPFPAEVEKSYNATAQRLAKLGKDVYVYPLWETHVTVMTFLNFSLYKKPSREQLAELRAWMAPIVDVIRPLFEKEGVKPFRLEFRKPVLTRKAAILPIADPSGEIPRIRRRASQLLEGNKGLCAKLSRGGLNVPGIIHSTIARWKKPPRSVARFVSGFDAVAAAARPFAIDVREIFFTAEIKPYMRDSKIMHRFVLT